MESNHDSMNFKKLLISLVKKRSYNYSKILEKFLSKKLFLMEFKSKLIIFKKMISSEELFILIKTTKVFLKLLILTYKLTML
jgi:hypothetical protein